MRAKEKGKIPKHFNYTCYLIVEIFKKIQGNFLARQGSGELDKKVEEDLMLLLNLCNMQ